jgi:hypothetical protein
MTTKERLHKLVDEISEQEAGETLRLMAARRQGANIDRWGAQRANRRPAMSYGYTYIVTGPI